MSLVGMCESRPLPNLVKVSGRCVFDLTGFPSTGYSGGTAADLHCLPYYRDEPKCIRRDLNLLCVVSYLTHQSNLNGCVILCQIAFFTCLVYPAECLLVSCRCALSVRVRESIGL